MLCPPILSGADILCTNAHSIHWMIGAIFVKFSQLILVKIIKIVATRCQILRLKCTKSISARAPPQTLLGELTAPPAPIHLRGLLVREKEGKEGVHGGKGSPLLFFCRSMPINIASCKHYLQYFTSLTACIFEDLYSSDQIQPVAKKHN